MSDADFTHEQYRAMVETGLKAGYYFGTFDRIDAIRSGSAKACLLRHDCDNDLVAAADLAKLEHDMGIRSTYFIMLRSALYNVLAPRPAALVREIMALGHRIGLHFDEKKYEAADPDIVRTQVDRERAFLEQEFGQEIDVVSFHQPSRRVMDNAFALSCVNTYDRRDMLGFHYVSDSNLRYRGQTPVECFSEGKHRLLHILLHPEWWTKEPMSVDDKWNRILTSNVTLMQNDALEREATYTKRRSFTVQVMEDSAGKAC